MKKIFSWLDARLPLVSTFQRYCSQYYIPKNLNVYYCFGALALLVLFNQLFTGIWLSMFYTPSAAEAFNSIEYIMRDVNFGWLLRHMHTTGASAFYIVLYLHLFRGLLYGSYQKPRELVWILGVMLFVISLAQSFFGYLLPWGQMSYWAGQVITSLFSVIPYFGEKLVIWVRGDFVVSTVTLQRFYSLHVIAFPLLILFFIFLHIVAIHHVGSNNPDGIDIKKVSGKNSRPLDSIPFYPYFMLKDFLAILIFLIIFFAIVFFCPDMGGYFLEPANYLKADTLQSPEQIKPVWYMMPFYSILRAIPNKALGVFLMMSSLLILFFLPWLDKSPVRSMRYKGCYSKCGLYSLVVSFLLLGYLGMKEPNWLEQLLARVCIFVYFSYFLLMPIYTKLEKHKEPPTRISA
ncbi:MAG: cytochrome b N-terminal domain-containing protein [Legionellaceae bacterium]|nr:cytochrome b N-terminal domain-containing protein [Legionellaceae bacterium]